MTDPSTLFLSSPQIRPSWTINGLTLELNLAPTPGGATTVSEGNNYGTPTFQGIHPSNATTGTVFASVIGQGQCSTPLRLAVRGGTSCWTQAAPSETGKKSAFSFYINRSSTVSIC
ncbi:hypothetical protein V9T40_011001 [Parthenolecanium corni]|uniref:Uncharacterized protein n=1 Tax=Parthenolecanium corni TaxID=536013 RepID=A0AAN9T579_9HEMI